MTTELILCPPWEGGPLFLTTSEAARILRSDPRTVRRGIDAGEIQAVRVSEATVRIRAEQFWREVVGLPGPEDTNSEPASSLPANVRAIARGNGGPQHAPDPAA